MSETEKIEEPAEKEPDTPIPAIKLAPVPPAAATELQFLIDLLLNHKLKEPTKKLIADRIGHVEMSLRQPGNQAYVPRGTIQPIAMHPATIQQAPSTLAAMARQNLPAEAFTAPSGIPAIQAPPVATLPASARIIGGQVNTPGGSRGPRKF